MAKWTWYKFSWAPFLAAVVWGGTLISLFVLWRTNGPPSYKNNVTIILISYIGAKWLSIFIPGSVVTAVLYITTLVLDVVLRRTERIPNFLRRRESAGSILSLIFGSIAAVALALLSIFNVHDYHSAHWAFTLVFILGVAANAICNAMEIRYLSQSYVEHAYIRRNSIAKLVLVAIGVVFAIIMGVLFAACDDRNNVETPHCNRIDSTAAVMEWSISVIFFGFLVTYIVDFRAEEDQPPGAVREPAWPKPSAPPALPQTGYAVA